MTSEFPVSQPSCAPPTCCPRVHRPPAALWPRPVVLHGGERAHVVQSPLPGANQVHIRPVLNTSLNLLCTQRLFSEFHNLTLQTIPIFLSHNSQGSQTQTQMRTGAPWAPLSCSTETPGPSEAGSPVVILRFWKLLWPEKLGNRTRKCLPADFAL